MIKVIIERHIKEGQDVSPLLREIRAAAMMHYPGFVSGKTLVNMEDSSIILVICNWEKVEDWERWAMSDTRAKLYQKIKPYLVEKPKVRKFKIMATEHEAAT